jgi:hypothetical protein
MEFVLRGINPKLKDHYPEESYYSEYEKYIKKGVGIYFRTDEFCWIPIWYTIVKFCHPAIINDLDADRGYSDKGHTINEEKSLGIAEVMERKIISGEVAKHFKESKNKIARLPRTFCSSCDGIGVQEYKLYDGHRRVKDPYLLDTKNSDRYYVKCHVCDGSGHFLNDICTHFVYDMSMLLEFLIFCQYSGGFSIR